MQNKYFVFILVWLFVLSSFTFLSAGNQNVYAGNIKNEIVKKKKEDKVENNSDTQDNIDKVDVEFENPGRNIGNYWVYKFTFKAPTKDIEWKGTVKREIKDIVKIELGNTTYQTYKIISNFNFNKGGKVDSNIYGDFIPCIDNVEYRRTSDLALIKSKEITKRKEGSNIINNITYDPALIRYGFPMEVGKKWNIKGYQNVTSTTSSSAFYPNESLEGNYECTEFKNIETEAGAMNCYIIKEKGHGFLTSYSGHIYLNESVNNFVRRNYKARIYRGGIVSEMTMNLTSYSLKQTKKHQSKDTPGFELILLLSTISIILFWKKQHV